MPTTAPSPMPPAGPPASAWPSDGQAAWRAELAAALAPGDGLGDLARAAAACDAAAAGAAPGSAGWAEAVLVRASVAVLAGDTGLALRLCGQAEAAAAGEPVLALRCATVSHLATIGHHNTGPDQAGLGAAELTARWPGVAYAQAEWPRWQAAFQAVADVAERQTAWLAHELVAGLPTQRYLAANARFLPPMPGDGPTPAALLDQGAERLLQLQAAVPAWAPLGNAAADLAWRAGDRAQAAARLQAVDATCARAGWLPGQALCAQTRGDWCAAPASHPLAMNLLLMEGSSEGSDLSWTCEAAEGERNGLDAAAASGHYARARLLWAAAAVAVATPAPATVPATATAAASAGDGLGPPRALAGLALREAWLRALAGDPASAAALAEEAAAAFAAAGDAAGRHLAAVHAALHRLATPQRLEDASACVAAGRWGAGDGSFSQALGLGLLCNRVARDALIRCGDAERALATYRLAEALFTALGAHANAAQSLIDQARCARAVGERRMAQALLEQALERMADDAAARPALAPVLWVRRVMATITAYQLPLAERDAEGMARLATRLAALLPDTPPPTLAQLLEGGADVQQAMLTENARDLLAQARVLVPLYRATAARDAGQPDAARAGFDAALAAAQAAGNQQHFLEATVWAQQRATPQAVAAFERYLAAGGAESGLAGQLTEVWRRLGGAPGEAEVARQRQRTAEQRLAFMVAVRAWAEARRALDALREHFGEAWWQASERPWEEWRQIAEIAEAEGRFDEALAAHARAIGLLEARRAALRRDDLKLAIAGERAAQDLYFMAARTALRAGDAAQAFAHLQGGRARALLDLVSRTRAGRTGAEAAADDLLGRWRQAQGELALLHGLLAQARADGGDQAGRIAALGTQLDAAEATLHTTEAALARDHPGIADLLGQGARLPTLAEACAALPEGVLLLEWALVGDELLAWALTRAGMVQQHLAPVEAAALARQVRALAEACARRRPVQAPAAALAEVLLAPFAALLRGHERVVLVPYGVLHRLPWAVLPLDGVPLGLSHRLSVLPTAGLLGQRRIDAPVATGPAARLVAVGNPEGDLPGAEVEAAAMARLHGGRALLRGAATAEAVLAALPGARLLHLACHGQLDEAVPLASALRLAGGDSLPVHRLIALRLEADLVVLSACDSGRGQATAGDDLLGLTRGLLAAGAQAALVSLWPVDDVSTAVFMHRFHSALVAGEPPAEALRSACRALQGMTPAERDQAWQALVQDGRADGGNSGGNCGGTDVGTGGSAGGHAIGTHVTTGSMAPTSRDRRIGAPPPAPADDPRHPAHWAAFMLVG